ncbi:MAG: molybdopterin molybdotransferase MoeA [Phycisphaerales bacterium]|nr:molybdopterin molybdotransferase MoeA [Phycisphaerales bacterium]
MVTLADAEAIVRANLNTLPVVSVPLKDARGMTLARTIHCDIDVPPFARSMMDGYAVRSADVQAAPVELRVIGQVAAGATSDRVLGPGEAMQINTGAPIPGGADAVVKVEDTTVSSDGAAVTVNYSVPVGKAICPRADYVAQGDVALDRGDTLGPEQIAIAATVGAATVEVFRRPRIAVLVTGDELVAVDVTPVGGQIRDSNGPMLRSLLTDAGAEVIDLGRVGDDRDALVKRVREGLGYDGLCITGGISMGAFDFVPDVLAECGVRVHFRKMSTKPGRPTLFGTSESGGWVFALPGNPISAHVGFALLVRPALAMMQGRENWPTPRRAVLRGQCGANGQRQSFQPARLSVADDGRCVVEPLAWRGSGDPFGFRFADVLLMRPANAPAVEDGALVEVIPLRA